MMGTYSRGSLWYFVFISYLPFFTLASLINTLFSGGLKSNANTSVHTTANNRSSSGCGSSQLGQNQQQQGYLGAARRRIAWSRSFSPLLLLRFKAHLALAAATSGSDRIGRSGSEKGATAGVAQLFERAMREQCHSSSNSSNGNCTQQSDDLSAVLVSAVTAVTTAAVATTMVGLQAATATAAENNNHIRDNVAHTVTVSVCNNNNYDSTSYVFASMPLADDKYSESVQTHSSQQCPVPSLNVVSCVYDQYCSQSLNSTFKSVSASNFHHNNSDSDLDINMSVSARAIVAAKAKGAAAVASVVSVMSLFSPMTASTSRTFATATSANVDVADGPHIAISVTTVKSGCEISNESYNYSAASVDNDCKQCDSSCNLKAGVALDCPGFISSTLPSSTKSAESLLTITVAHELCQLHSASPSLSTSSVCLQCKFRLTVSSAPGVATHPDTVIAGVDSLLASGFTT